MAHENRASPRQSIGVDVDLVYGIDDPSWVFGGPPFRTLEFALGFVQAGDTLQLGDGTFDVAADLAPPPKVAIRGRGVARTTIRRTTTLAATMLTASDGLWLEDLQLRLVSNQHVPLVGVHLAGTSAVSARFIESVIIVDNSAAGDAGSSDVVGVLSDGTGMPPSIGSTLNLGNVYVSSSGQGRKRGILVTGSPNRVVTRSLGVQCRRVGNGAGSYVAAEVDVVDGFLALHQGTADGSDADILPTSGPSSIEVGGALLVHGTTGGRNFKTTFHPQIVTFADPTALVGGRTTYLRPHAGNGSAVEQFAHVEQPTVIKEFHAHLVRAPGSGKSVTLRLRRSVDGVPEDAPIEMVFSGSEVNKSNVVDAVSLGTGDGFGWRCVNGLGSVASGLLIHAEAY